MPIDYNVIRVSYELPISAHNLHQARTYGNQVDWFRNLFKSHTQKRMEARCREEEARRMTQRTAGPMPAKPPVNPASETPVPGSSKPPTRLDKAS